MTTPAEADLNQVIIAAVNARIEASVAAALSGDDVIGKYVAAALNEPIEVKDRSGYRTRKTSYLREVIDGAIREATKAAVSTVIAEEREAIERAVRAELRERTDALAVQLVGSAVAAVEKPYGVSIKLEYPSRD